MKRHLSACLAALLAVGVAAPLPTSAQQSTGSGLDLPQGGIDRSRLTQTANDQDLLTAMGWTGPLALTNGTVKAVIELDGIPTAGVYGLALQNGQNETDANTTARTALAQIERQQQQLLPRLASVNASTIYRTQRVYNGIAVSVDAARLAEIARMPGVKAIHPLVTKTLDNTGSVPLVKAPDVWRGKNARAATGTGIKVGIIDTGIDYVHTNFGGNGDYTGITDAGAPRFNAKVVGGYDFVGDAYNADPSSATYSPTPVPDNNPMDCNGHGTHVAGTAAGYGVNKNGTTYTGRYNGSTNFSQFSIGPGVAPQANLYGLRVFGCDGSTDVTDVAIEWAVDPNGDGNFSDKLDVINMSLGSGYGSDYDSTVVASEMATAAGVIVVASAGNDGDVYYATGSPASGNSVISVASTRQPDTVYDAFRTNPAVGGKTEHPAFFSVNYDWANSAPVSGKLVYIAGDGVGCSAFTPEQTAVISGNVLLLDWSDGFCGSGARGGRIVAAGGVGFIIADNSDVFDLLLSGSPVIPAVSTSKAVGAALKANLNKNIVVTFDNALASSQVVSDPSLNDTLSDFSSRGPNRANKLKPDVAAPGDSIFSAATGTGTRGQTLSGTSMAAPHVAGGMALLKQVHPTWTVAQLKALVMNTALTDVKNDDKSLNIDPARAGTGRMDLDRATNSNYIAYDSTNAAGVSASFGLLELTGKATVTRQITLENLGTSPKTFNVSFVNATNTPGVTFSVSPSRVTVGNRGKVNVTLTMTADPALLQNVFQPTVGSDDGLRAYLTDASGYVSFRDTSNRPALRVTAHAIPVAVSEMSGTLSSAIDGATAPVNTTIALSGTGLLGTDVPTETLSIATAFELQGTSPRMMATDTVTDYADLQAFGVSEGTSPIFGEVENRLYFGVATYGEWQTPGQVEFDVSFDTNRDGKVDYILYTSTTGTAANPNDIFVTKLVKLTAAGGLDTTFGTQVQALVNEVVPGIANTRLYNTNVMFLPVNPDAMGLTAGSTFDYSIASFSLDSVSDESTTATYTYGKPGVAFSNNLVPGIPAFADVPGETIGVNFDAQAFANNRSQGVLLLHHHNKQGTRVQTLAATSGLQPEQPVTPTPSPSPTPNPGPNSVTVFLPIVSRNR